MTLETYLVIGICIFIATIQLLVTKKIKSWPTLGILMAMLYSFFGIITYQYITNSNQSYGNLGDLMIDLFGLAFILLCAIFTLLLTLQSLSKYSVMTQLGGLLAILVTAYLLTYLYQTEQLQKATPEKEEYLDPVNNEIEAKNKMLEEGIDPNSKH